MVNLIRESDFVRIDLSNNFLMKKEKSKRCGDLFNVWMTTDSVMIIDFVVVKLVLFYILIVKVQNQLLNNEI